MVLTRQQTQLRKRARLFGLVDQVPVEVWIQVLSYLPCRDIATSATVCKSFAGIQQEVLHQACMRRFPEWTLASQAPADANWKRLYDVFEQRERDYSAVASQAAVTQTQKVVHPSHRAVLAEWLIGVAEDWHLDSTVVFKAISYLDHYLSHVSVEVLCRFQLVGIACIRCAIHDAQLQRPFKGIKSSLDPERFAFISDGVFTPAQVEEKTSELQQHIPKDLRTAPTAKMFLRTFWYRLLQADLAAADQMHLYTVASFFLQLSLVDFSCTGYPACISAAASLSLSLEAYSHTDCWPAILQNYSGIIQQDLVVVKQNLRQAQETLELEHFRRLWRRQPELQPQSFRQKYPNAWQRARQIMSYPSIL